MTIEAPDRHVTAIQMLRAIAATMVIFVHIDSELIRLRLPSLGAAWLATGVDIFFVISGFIMWTSVERRGAMSAGQFLTNRFIRIVPLYWAVTTLVVAVGLIAPHLLNTTVLRPFNVFASFLFLPARHPVFENSFWPVVVPGWSLNYEMLFYVVFAIAIAVAGRSRFKRVALIGAMLISIFLVANFLLTGIDLMRFYANPIIFEFLIGVFLAMIWLSGRIRPSYVFAVLIPTGIAGLWLGSHSILGSLAVQIGATLTVAGAVFLPRLPNNFLSRLGDASYSLYLTHGIVLSALAWVFEALAVNVGLPVFILLGTAAAISAAFVVYASFELPVTAALKRQFGSRIRPTDRIDTVVQPSAN